jgi:amino acid transporter
MVTSVIVSGFFGYMLILSLTWVIPDVAKVLNAHDRGGNPLPAVLAITQLTLGERAVNAVLALTVLAMWFCGLATVTSLSRTFYAFARDKGMPASSLWSRISPRHQVPAAAIWLSAALAFVTLLYSGAYAVVAAISVIGFYLSYIIPVYLGWRKKSLWISKRGPWHLGSRSNMMNILACAWTLAICAIMVARYPRPSLGVGAGVGALYLLHRLTGRHEMRKPVWEAGEENSIGAGRELRGEKQ